MVLEFSLWDCPSPHRIKGVAIYCPGCNERFRKRNGGDRCPRCRVELVPVNDSSLNETLLLKDFPDDLNDTRTTGIRIDEVDKIIGRLLDIYRCDTLLGSGGMGKVYLANHTELNRRCALKVLSSRISISDVDFIERFKSEGRATAALNHPNVVTIHSIGECDGHYFLEMEYVKGQSLQEILDEQGAFTPIRATVLTEGIAEGLAAAHREGILHRDLKPDNVLLTELGIPKLADFGLAKRIFAEDIKEDEVLVGTPNFMAPELFQGTPASSQSDVYSLGVCYFYLLTGTLPFASGSFSDLRNRAIHEPLPNVRETNPKIPLEMAECLSLLMEKSPKNRPRDGIEAAQLLHAVAGQVQDIESLLSEAFQNTAGITWLRKNSLYELTVELPDGRKQRLFIEPSEHSASERLLLIYSICGPAHSNFFEEALRLNSVLSHGGIALREIDGVRNFVMLNTYPRGSVDTVGVRRSVLEIADQADKIEKHLTGDDFH